MNLKTLVGTLIGVVITVSDGSAQTAEPEPELRDLETLKKGLVDTTAGFYLSPIFSAGYVIGDLDINQGGVVIEDEFDGWLVRFGGALGYQTSSLRSEIELTAGRAETELEDLNQENKDNFVKLSALSFFDVPYDLSKLAGDALPETIPYVGFGVGGLYYDVEDADSDITFVAEILAGLGFRLSPRWFIDGGYRWTYIPILENEGTESEVSFNGIEAKLRYRF